MSSTNRIIIAGGSGFVGRALATEFSNRGKDVVILTRSPQRWRGPGRAVQWDGKALGAWASEIDGADAVVNLAGKNVNCRYTPSALKEVDESRVNAVKVMGAAIQSCAHPPGVLVQAATTAIYGDAGEKWCDESTPAGDGVPPRTATQWERAFGETETLKTRRVSLRMSFVLGRNGGPLSFLSRLTRCFLGGTVGNGRQYISWIHIDDLIRIISQAIDDDRMSGIYNVATANPVSNAEFMRELRHALHRPWSPPAPAWLVRLGCFVLRTEPVLALTGRRAFVGRLLQSGFQFKHPELHEALRDLLFNAPSDSRVLSTAARAI